MSEMLDFDFDTKLSEVADLGNFSNPADGTHIYALVFCGPDLSLGENPVVGLSLVYQKLGTVELVDPKANDSAVGSILKENFTGNKTAKEVFRMRMSQIFGKDAVKKAEEEGQSFRPFINQLAESTKENSQFYMQMVTKIVTTYNAKKKQSYDNVRILDIKLLNTSDVTLPENFDFYDYSPSLPEGDE